MNKRFAYCPIEITFNAIGGKYKPVILFHLLKGSRRGVPPAAGFRAVCRRGRYALVVGCARNIVGP
jgi:hypothetical protein